VYEPDKHASKLRAKAWATTTLKVAVAEDGRSREMFALHIDSVPMWLATIEPSRVSEATRAKLSRYQCEAARVLAAHFLPRTQPPPSGRELPPDPIYANGARMKDSDETRDEMRRYCELAGKAAGWSVRLAQGLVRRRHHVSSCYWLGVALWPSMRSELHDIALGRTPRALPAKLRLVKPTNVRQLNIPGTSS
jgi:hypothetical protein